MIGEDRDGGQFSFLNNKKMIQMHNENNSKSPVEVINAGDLNSLGISIMNRSRHFRPYHQITQTVSENYGNNKQRNELNRNLGKPTELLAG